MSKTKDKRYEGLPYGWRRLVVEKLAEQGIQRSPEQITQLYGGYTTSDGHTMKILEVILKVKEDYQNKKEQEKKLREAILS